MNKLWYKAPAKDWNEALPLGNGRLGAMVFGGVYHESLQLNEDSIWYGRHKDRHNPEAKEAIPEIRKLIKEKKYDEANKLSATSVCSVPESQCHYEPLGDLFLTFAYPDEDGKINVGEWANLSVMHKVTDYNKAIHQNYTRDLDLETATATTSYTVCGVKYTRTAFISYPDNALVVNIKADKPGSIYCWTQISRQRSRFIDYTGKYDEKTLMFSGECGEGGIRFASCMRAENTGGKRETKGQYTIIEGADEVTIKLVAETTFRAKKPVDKCMERLDNIEDMSYDDMLLSHFKDYQSMYTRSCVSIEDTQNAVEIPTDERLKRISEGESDPQMVSLYYEFGKYLTIAASRQGSLPSNLQGIWNDLMRPPWDSKYTININLEMNYWPTDIMNLHECALPFFDLLERMRKNGRVTARKMYGCRGYAAHHNTDIWADTAPQDACLTASCWAMGAAWMATHIFEHYLFTDDKSFLEEKFYTMIEAAVFLIDFMQEDESVLLVTSPSMSPENSFIAENGEITALCESPAMDFQIIRLLFNQCVKSAEILGREDNPIIAEIKEALPKLREIKISSDGRIMEWDGEYEEKDPDHRHMSHLFALYPDCSISPKTPELFCAAQKSLEYRLSHKGGGTGWSRAWIINFWARLLSADEVDENVRALFSLSSYPNLFDKHAPFQIDGNFGGASGIAEAILQSHSGEIYILPALPTEWGEGEAFGLKARGGYTVDIAFKNGKLIYADILAGKNTQAKLRFSGKIKLMSKNESFKKLDESLYSIELEANKKTRIEPAG